MKPHVPMTINGWDGTKTMLYEEAVNMRLSLTRIKFNLDTQELYIGNNIY